MNTSTVEPTKRLLKVLDHDPVAVSMFYELPDNVRDLFNQWATLNKQERDEAAAAIMAAGEGRTE